MKKNVSIILTSFLLTFTNAASANAEGIANFSGHWIASVGKVSSNVGLSSNCSRVEIIIEQSDTAILIKKYNAECAMFGSSWGPVSMEIKGTKVFENGEEVGHISADTLITISQEPSAAYAFNLKLISDASGKPIMESYYGVKNGVGAIATEANLAKANELF